MCGQGWSRPGHADFMQIEMIQDAAKYDMSYNIGTIFLILKYQIYTYVYIYIYIEHELYNIYHTDHIQ